MSAKPAAVFTQNDQQAVMTFIAYEPVVKVTADG